MKIRQILASEIAVLDSNVHTGGGTDDTAALQSALDTAALCGGVHLIMDGAALVSGLRIHSNTTIECLTKDCGFFQKPDSNRPLITNYKPDFYTRKTRNIILRGGTYNQNCLQQAHHVPATEATKTDCGVLEGNHWVYCFAFYGVEQLELRELTVRNFRTFAVTIGGFRNVTIENVWLDLPDRMQAQNQDGFHFWGPGQFLTIRNVGGRVGDDFMNLGPDEVDCTSSITDVLIDGVFHDDADQSIRMLSRGTGTLDRVTVRNITGTYRSFGFYINNWFSDGTYGDFKNIFIENVDLRQTAPNYDYRPPILFNVGGNVESLIIKNVRHHHPCDGRALLELGRPYCDLNYPFSPDNLPRMENIVVDGLTIMEESPNAANADYIQVYLPVERLALKDITVLRKNTGTPAGHLISIAPEGSVDSLYLNDIVCNGFTSLIDHPESIGKLTAVHVAEE